MAVTTPDNTLDSKDTGDETLKRFRYQITYSAIISLSLLDTLHQVDEVFCEQFEDVLVKMKDGKFIGIQVKTKDLNLGPFKTDDEQILHSIKRFIHLERKFPEKFIRYTIVSNAGFYGIDSTYKNLEWVINLAKGKNTVELLKVRSNSKKIICDLGKETGCSEEDVINVISKIELKGSAAGLDHIFLDLQNRLDIVEKLKGQTLGIISQVANRLITFHFSAASLFSEPKLTEEYLYGTSVEDEKKKAVIEGKKVTKEKITKLIDECIDEPVSLLTQGKSSLEELPKGDRKLVVKMDKGGLSLDNVNLQRDNKYAAEKHFVSWIHKHGEAKARMQYDQVKLIVQNECQGAFDECNDVTKEFGTDMLKDIRKRLKGRMEAERNSFFDCKQEHLLGMSGILTEDCKVWWSKKFDLE